MPSGTIHIEVISDLMSLSVGHHVFVTSKTVQQITIVIKKVIGKIKNTFAIWCLVLQPLEGLVTWHYLIILALLLFFGGLLCWHSMLVCWLSLWHSTEDRTSFIFQHPLSVSLWPLLSWLCVVWLRHIGALCNTVLTTLSWTWLISWSRLSTFPIRTSSCLLAVKSDALLKCSN